MAILSKLSTKSARTPRHLSATATKAKAKVGLRLPRGETVLSGLKVSTTIASKLGGSVPYMQGIADTMDQIVAYADVSRFALSFGNPTDSSRSGYEEQSERVQANRGAHRRTCGRAARRD